MTTPRIVWNSGTTGESDAFYFCFRSEIDCEEDLVSDGSESFLSSELEEETDDVGSSEFYEEVASE